MPVSFAAEREWDEMKVCHKAKFIAQDESGDVSALCYADPHRIDLAKATWTIRQEAVTCSKCLKIMRETSR